MIEIQVSYTRDAILYSETELTGILCVLYVCSGFEPIGLSLSLLVPFRAFIFGQYLDRIV
jgi:hypothetical protein